MQLPLCSNNQPSSLASVRWYVLCTYHSLIDGSSIQSDDLLINELKNEKKLKPNRKTKFTDALFAIRTDFETFVAVSSTFIDVTTIICHAHLSVAFRTDAHE